MATIRGDEILFDYGDGRTCFYQGDYASIRGTEWYKDSVIQFFIWTLKCRFGDDIAKKGVLFVNPGITQIVQSTYGVVKEYGVNASNSQGLLEQLPPFGEYRWIFAVLNSRDQGGDAIPTKMTVDSGNHWTLLFIDMANRMAYHYDYLNGESNREAREFCHVVTHKTGTELENVEWVEEAPTDSTNSHCGPIACWIMRELLHRVRDLRPDEIMRVDFDRDEECQPKRERLMLLDQCLVEQYNQVPSKRQCYQEPSNQTLSAAE